MNFTDFVMLVLAHGGVVDIWLNGSLFAEARSWLQAHADESPAEEQEPGSSEPIPEGVEITSSPWTRFGDRIIPRWVAELLMCSFCLSPHVAFSLAVLFFVPALLLPEPWSSLMQLPVYALAAARAGWIVNAILPSHLRYDRFKQL